MNRRLDVIKTITYQPPLLKKTEEIYFEDEHSPHSECILKLYSYMLHKDYVFFNTVKYYF